MSSSWDSVAHVTTREITQSYTGSGCGTLQVDPAVIRDNRFGSAGHHPHRMVSSVRVGRDARPSQPSRALASRSTDVCQRIQGGRVPRTGRLGHTWHRVNGSLPLTDYDLSPPVLDVGANTGEALLALRTRGVEAVGLEPNARAVSIARRGGAQMIEGAIESTPLSRQALREHGLLSQVLEHVRRRTERFRIAGGALRSDGVI